MIHEWEFDNGVGQPFAPWSCPRMNCDPKLKIVEPPESEGRRYLSMLLEKYGYEKLLFPNSSPVPIHLYIILS